MPFYLAIGYDVEMPLPSALPEKMIARGEYNRLDASQKKTLWQDYIGGVYRGRFDEELVDESIREISNMQRVHDIFSRYGVGFTAFLSGRFIDYVDERKGADILRNTFLQKGIEISSHSYEHMAFRSTGVESLDKISPAIEKDEVKNQLKKANGVISRIFNVRPKGLKGPMGYTSFMGKEEIPILQAMKEEGMGYLSSFSKKAPREPNRLVTQPYVDLSPRSYENLGFPDILEIPIVGYFDVHGSLPTSLLVFDSNYEWSVPQRTAYYKGLIEEGASLSEMEGRNIFATLVVHPWAIPYYDPELKTTEKILDFCAKRSVRVVTYADIHKMNA
jgi:peptidoglycan/xylan/chitin deacetylase (PgdA/CDA1 family)